MSEIWASFDGPVTSAEPLTWGQRSIWKAYSEFRPHTAWLNIARVLAVPGRAKNDIDSVTRAIGTLLSRHESLRTRILAEPELHQVPHASGRIQLSQVELEGGATPESVKDEMGDVPYDYLTEWPLRAKLLTSGGVITHVALVFSHVAVDYHASEILLRELRLLLLRGQVGALPGMQSAAIARNEQGPMKHRSERAQEHWLSSYTHLPECMFPVAGPPLSPRFRRALLISRAADLAMRLIAARHRVSTATVLLAAASALIGSWTGHEHSALFTMVNNRYQPGYRDAISKLNQLGLFALDLRGRPGFDELIPRAWQAATRGYRNAYYDPAAMDRAIAQTGRPTGSAFEPWCYFNDLRLPGLTDSAPVAEVDESRLRAIMGCTTLTWPEKLDRFAWQFRLQVLDTPDGVGLSLTADTERLPPPKMELFLRELEQLLVTAAFRDLPHPWRP